MNYGSFSLILLATYVIFIQEEVILIITCSLLSVVLLAAAGLITKRLWSGHLVSNLIRAVL